MKRGLPWFIAKRYLATRRRGRFLSLISLIAMGGVTLGVMALITVMAVMAGLQREMQRLILGSAPHIYVFDSFSFGSFRLGDWRAALPEIASDPAVVAAEPFVYTLVVAIAGELSNAQPAQLTGIDPFATDIPVLDIENQIREGEYAFGPTKSRLPGILVGSGVAGTLGVFEGDTLVLAAPERFQIAGGSPYFPTREFEVTGIFHTGMYEYDTNYLYVSLAAAQDLMGFTADTVSGIIADVADPWFADEVKRRITASTESRYHVQSWTDLNAQLFSALKLEKIAMFVILFLIVVVAAFNIISTLVMVVTEKTREIGILKSMGMTDRGVLRIFMLQGLAIGLIGTLLGSIGGVVLVLLLDRYQFIKLPGSVYFIDYLPVALEPLDVAAIVGASVLIAFVATIHPARQASKLEVVDAIRHD